MASVDIIKLPVLFFGHIGCDAPGMLNQTYTSGMLHGVAATTAVLSALIWEESHLAQPALPKLP